MAAEKILESLKQLQTQNKPIEACMVAKKGLEGVIMFPESFKKDAGPVWEPLSKTLNDTLSLVEKYCSYNLDKICVQVLGYGIAFYVLGSSDTALIVFVKKVDDTLKTLTNLQPEIEKTRQKILQSL